MRAQRPLNVNGTVFGVDSSTIRPSLRGFSTFNGGYGPAASQHAGGFEQNGNGATGDGNGQQFSASNRKLNGRQSLNALDVARPNGGGGDATNGNGGAGAYGPGGGGGAGWPPTSGLDALRRKQKVNGLGGAGVDESMPGTAAGGGAGYGQTGRGRKQALNDLRKNISRVRERQNDEATLMMPVPMYGGYDKNPLSVLKEKFRNDVSAVLLNLFFVYIKNNNILGCTLWIIIYFVIPKCCSICLKYMSLI